MSFLTDLITNSPKNPAKKRSARSCVTMMNKVPYGNPTASKRMPATVGPTKAPRAKTEVHRPEMSP